MRLAALAFLVLCTMPLPAQQDRSKRIVERPIKSAVAAPSDKVDLREATGLVWHEGLEAVVHRGKPIVLMQLLGRLDDVFC